MGVREIAHAIRGRGPGNHFLFFKQQRDSHGWRCEARRTTAGEAQESGEAELGTELPVLPEPSQ